MTYAYDTLQRLISAATTDPSWGLSFSYDGFGNRTASNVTKGSAPYFSAVFDGSTNRMVGGGYDANGNQTYISNVGPLLTYDVENRLTSAGGNEFYAYAPGNQRIWKQMPDGTEEFYFYGISGQKLGTYHRNDNVMQVSDTNVYFGSRTIVSRGVTVQPDRLGSNFGRYFPYGEEKLVTAQDRDKFATYYRDGTTGLDYAQNRYYANTLGRFLTPDPYKASAGTADPQSWNRYSYVQNNPVNFHDPRGLSMTCEDCGEDGEVVCEDGYYWDSFSGFCKPYGGVGTNPTPETTGGGGGGPGSDTIPGVVRVTGANQNGINQTLINVAVLTLQNIIDPDCQKWLESGAVGDFSAFANNALQAIGHGAIDRVGSTGVVITGNDVINAVTGGFNNLSIVINDNGAFYRSSVSTDNGNIKGGTLKGQIFLLLHEFAHLNQVPGFRNDSTSRSAGFANNIDIENNCNKTLKRKVLN